MRTIVVSALAVVAMAGLVAWYYTTHEKVEEQVWVGYSGEARYNRFLAADRLLNAVGVEAESRESFLPTTWLPAASDTILMRASATVATGEEFDALTAWVNDWGGHLVLLPPREPNAAVDDLLAYFGLSLEAVEPVDSDAADDDDADAADDASAEDTSADDESSADDDYDYVVFLSHTYYRIRSDREDAVTTLSDDLGNIAVRVAEGNGYVTVVASPAYFTNDFLDEADHARLLLDVVAGYLDPGKVWLIFQASFPSLGEIIWQSAPYLVVSLFALFLFWLWATMPRFGPKVLPDSEVRRSINEHVSAAGTFTWRNAGSKALLESAVTALINDAERRHPGIGRLPMEKQAESLAHLTGIDTNVIFSALIAADGERPREFTDNIQLLQTIRKAL